MRTDLKAVLLSLFACFALYGQSANGVTFVQPGLPGPPPLSGSTTPPLNVNQKLAQIVNLADFDSQPTLSCSTNTHDDGPAMNRAIMYVTGATDGANGNLASGGGTLQYPYGKNCYVNTFAYQVVGVGIPTTQNGLKLEGNWSTITLGANLSSGVIFGNTVLAANPPAYDDAPVTAIVGALAKNTSRIQLATPSDCSKFKVGDPVWIKGGYGLASETNAELNKTLGCDSTAGWLYLYWPMAKPYVGPGAPVAWTPGTAYTVGQTTMVGNNVFIVTHAGTSGPTTPVWNPHGDIGVDTQPPAYIGDGAGGIGTMGQTPCTSGNYTTCPTVLNVQSTAGIVAGMTVFGKGIDPMYPLSQGFPTVNTTVVSVNAGMNTVTLNQPINAFGVCVYVGSTCNPSPVQFYNIPPGVVWLDQGPSGVSNVKTSTIQNFTMQHMTLITLGNTTGVTVLNQTLSMTWEDVEFRMNGIANEWFVGGAGRNWHWNRIRWGAGAIHNPGIFYGAGGQIGYNTVDVEISDSDLTSQDWGNSPFYCSEYSAQIKVHDSRLSTLGFSIGAFNCFDVVFHHNQITSNGAENPNGGAAFLMGVCCGSIEIMNPVIDENTFNVTTPALAGEAGIMVGGSAMQFTHNIVNFTSGGLGTALYTDPSPSGSIIEGNVINTDGDGIFIGGTNTVNGTPHNMIIRSNIVTNTTAIIGQGLAPVNSSTLNVSGLTGTITNGMGVFAPGIPEGTLVGCSGACGGTINLVNSMGMTVSTYAAVTGPGGSVPIPVVFSSNRIVENLVGTAAILDVVGAQQYTSGPTITGNTWANFYWGLWLEGNNGSQFPGRQVGPNNTYGTTFAYNTAGISPMNYGPLNTINFNAPFNPNFGYQFFGRMHVWNFAPPQINPVTGADQDNSESLSLDSSTFNTLGIHSNAETNLLVRFTTPAYGATIGFGTLGGATAGGFAFGTPVIGTPNSPQGLRFGISSLGAQILSGSWLSLSGTAGATSNVSTGTGATLCTLTFQSGLFVAASGAGCAVASFAQTPKGTVLGSDAVPPAPAPFTDPNDSRLTGAAPAQ